MRAKKFLPLFLVSILTLSCGKYVDESSIKTKTIDDEINLVIDTTLQNINFTLPLAQIPIYDFINHRFVGQINFQEEKRMILQLNMTRILDDSLASECPLPNGNPIPHFFDGREKIYCFTTANKEATVYVAIEDELAIAGIAIPIKKLESEEVEEPFEFFSGIGVGGINGTIGTFLGTEPGQSGAAIFLNFSKWLPTIINHRPGNNNVTSPPAHPEELHQKFEHGLFDDGRIHSGKSLPKIRLPKKSTTLSFRQYQILKKLKQRMD